MLGESRGATRFATLEGVKRRGDSRASLPMSMPTELTGEKTAWARAQATTREARRQSMLKFFPTVTGAPVNAGTFCAVLYCETRHRATGLDL